LNPSSLVICVLFSCVFVFLLIASLPDFVFVAFFHLLSELFPFLFSAYRLLHPYFVFRMPRVWICFLRWSVMNGFLRVSSVSSGNISKQAATQLLITVREENRLFISTESYMFVYEYRQFFTRNISAQEVSAETSRILCYSLFLVVTQWRRILLGLLDPSNGTR
jgi:hypothetical protein